MAGFKCNGSCVRNGKPVCDKIWEEEVIEINADGEEVTRKIYHCELEEEE